MSNIWWPEVCGDASEDAAFWSEAITVNTSNPDFTQCFQDTALSWGPCGYLWIVSLFYIPHLKARQTYHRLRDSSTLNKFKVILTLMLCFVVILDLLKTVGDEVDGKSPELVYFIKPSVYIVTFALATFLTAYEFMKGIHAGGVLFFFWSLLVICGIVPFRSNILHISYEDSSPVIEDIFRFVTFYVFYAFVLVQFFVAFKSDLAAIPDARFGEREHLLSPYYSSDEDRQTSENTPPPCPEKTSNFLSRLCFLWLTPMIISGYKRAIVFADLWGLMPGDTCQAIVPTFEKAWRKEQEKYAKPAQSGKETGGFRNYGSTGVTGDEFKSKDPQMTSPPPVEIKEGGRPKRGRPKKEKGPSVWNAIVKTFGGYYMLGGLYKLVYDVISFISPQILNLLITFVGTGDIFEWRGYLYAIILFLVSVIKTAIQQQYWHVCFVVGMRLRTAITGTVYRKSLKLNSAARRKATVGEIVNLMSVDAQKLQDTPAYLHMLWSAPLTIALAMYFLWQQLGPSVLAGLGVMIMLVPINAYVAQKTRKLQIAQMMEKDNRIKLMNEVLNGIKVLKLYAWENSFRDRINDIRARELTYLKKAQYLSAASAISWYMAPYLVALGTFAVFVLSSPENILDANKAFVSLSLFNLMNYPLSILPGVISFGVQAAVSIGRITRFLKNEEIDPDNVTHDALSADAVSIKNGNFSWEKTEPPVLNNINMKVTAGGLVAVVGNVGSGKSSLVSAILGEMEVLGGQTTTKGSVAYVPQQAWIQNATLKNNILFEKRENTKTYNEVIDACALAADLKILPGGDQTEIGEKGINMSGGQKQRISLARAVYQNADIYVLDDPLSAVDSHVGKHIFDNVVGPKGLLRNKTRVLVTNSISYLSQMDHILVIKEGHISESGTYQELLSHHGAFAEFIQTYLNEIDEDDEDVMTDPGVSEIKEQLRRQISVLSGTDTAGSESDKQSGNESGKEGGKVRRRRKMSRAKSIAQEEDKIIKNIEKEQKEKSKLVAEESAEIGSVKFSIFTKYVRACGVIMTSSAAFWYLIFIGSQIAANIWLSEWSEDKPVNGTQDIPLRDLRLGVYGGIGLIQAFGVFGQSISIAIGTIAASGVLHTKLMSNILRAPMSFFDTTPLGRIVNRFAKDVDTVDVNIPLTLRIWMGTFTGVICTFVVICYSTPIFLAVAIPLLILYYFIQRFYVATSRQLKRIDSIRRSPIYVHFSESITGVSSIRAYKEQQRFIEKSDKLLDENQMAYYPSIVSNRWLGIMLETIGNFIVLFAGLFAVIQRDTMSAGLAGLSVSYALQVTASLNMVVRMTCDLENYIVAVERIQEYADCPTEAPAIIEGNRPPRNWPDTGVVEMQDYSTRYRDGLSLVLKNINCRFEGGERIGIVGRTGAGKSSLTLAFFRIIEAASGSILIDNQNASMIGLTDLRSKLTIIPQDPVLFSGNLRMNLDPFERHSDAEVWTALEQAHLKSFVSSLGQGLHHEISEGGENLSVGQRQLVCLARALLRKTKVLILDEATAAVDLETDDLIQNTIRSEFTESTIITIAHRLNTVVDYDRIMVLDNGEIAEFKNPDELLKDKNSIFYGMAKDAGLV